MTIEEAIDRNVELKGELLREGRLEKAEAVKLGIEALKAWKEARREGRWPSSMILPGETEE